MLFITRKPGELVVLTDKISGETVCKVKVETILEGLVKLGIHAPTTIKIDRDFYHGNKQNGD